MMFFFRTDRRRPPLTTADVPITVRSLLGDDVTRIWQRREWTRSISIPDLPLDERAPP